MFKVGQLISARGEDNGREIFEVVFTNRDYIQAINLKQNAFISFPRTLCGTYRVATDADIKSFLSRHLKYHLIQNYSENGTFKVSAAYVASL
jgi:hypothetical protein